MELGELVAPAHEGRQLDRQVVRCDVERAQGRRRAVVIVVAQLEHPLGVAEVAQAVHAAIAQCRAGRHGGLHQRCGPRRHDRLTAVGAVAQLLGASQRRAGIAPAVAAEGIPAVQRDAHLSRELGPGRALERRRRRQRVARRREDGDEAVPRPARGATPVVGRGRGVDRRLEQRGGRSGPHRPGRRVEVGDQEGHRARLDLRGSRPELAIRRHGRQVCRNGHRLAGSCPPGRCSPGPRRPGSRCPANQCQGATTDG